MDDLFGLPWLTTLGVVPLLGAVAVGVAPRAYAKVLALGTSLLVLLGTIAMSAGFEAGGARFQFLEHSDWIPSFGIGYSLGVDGIGLVLIALVAILMPVVVLASWDDCEEGGRSPKAFFGVMLVLETMMLGVFAATDVFLFYVFFEAMLIPMYFLIGSWGGPRRSYAAVKFLLYSLAGGLLMLAAVIGLYVVSSDTLANGTFDFATLSEAVRQGTLTMSTDVERALFLGFFIAFAIKAPLFPFHTWLPDAGAEAPIGGAVLLVGVLDKVGTFGFLRYCIPLFPHAARDLAPIVLALAAVGIFYGAFLAMGQRDLKRLVSYTSIAHFGFIALGTFAFTTQAGTGAVLYMVNHGLSTGALFLVVGFLISRGKSRMGDAYGGVGKVAPVLSGTFLIAGLSALALPGLSTFVSEFLVLVGTFRRYEALAVVATVGIILAALYVLIMYQRTMQGPLREDNAGFKDLSAREVFVIAPLIALIIALGVYPKPVLDVITPAVEATFQQDAGQADPPFTQPVAAREDR